ncbi:hypothetical protein [Paenisporosarcina sp. TG20]|uniref:hypothetical protein n=1 Tax=Paenisporosarcina sp. TG20 TaxID=1211706 RepID=UPI0002D95330|nr:hypothetical protein [Paenisporosarcina sp. TG20]
MKKILLNNNGYALLITLLLVVFFFALSTMFISSSLSHSRQEQTVDNSNQTVVAAEMGIQYYTTNVENLVALEAKQFTPTVQIALDEIKTRFNISMAEYYDGRPFSKSNEFYSVCRPFLFTTPPQFVELLDCEIDELKKLQPRKFMDHLIAANLASKVNLTERIVDDEKDLSYKISNIEFEITPADNDIVIDIYVEGLMSSQLTRKLRSELNIGSPDFLSVNKTPIISYSEEAVSDIFAPPNDTGIACTEPPSTTGTCTYTGTNLEAYLASIPADSEIVIKVVDYCKAIGKDSSNCNFSNFDGQDIPIYIKPPSGIVEAGNANSLEDSILYIDGFFDLNNMNQSSGNTIITRSIQMHNGVNLTDTTIVVMGDLDINKNKIGIVKWKESGSNNLIIGQDSKMCINLNAIDLVNSASFKDNSFSFDGNGKLIYYPRMTHDKLLPESPNQVIYTDDFEDFLKQCSVSMANIDGEYQMEYMETGDFDFDAFVNYNP